MEDRRNVCAARFGGVRLSRKAGALIATLSLILAACSSGTATQSPSAAASAPAPSAQAAASQAAPSQAAASQAPAPSTAGAHVGKTIAYVSFGQQYGYQVAITSIITKDAEAAGMKVVLYDGQGDANKQTTQVRTAISLKPDALIIDPVAPDLVDAGVLLANTNNIPVFILDSPPPTGKIVSLIANDSLAAGTAAGQEMAKLNTTGNRILEVAGALASTQVGLRNTGFQTGLDGAASKKIDIQQLKAEWSAQTAVTMVLDAFTVNPAVGGVWTDNDDMMGGVVQALQKLGKQVPVGAAGHIPLVSLDGDPLALKRIQTGAQDATMSSNVPKLAESMIAAITSYFDTGSAPAKVMVPYVLVDASNAADPSLWGNAK